MKPEEPIFHGDYSFNTGKLKQFSTPDYVIFAAVLVISAAIGFFFAWTDRNKKSIKDFLLAGGKMTSLPVALSLLGLYISLWT